jgi:hypothetical protein
MITLPGNGRFDNGDARPNEDGDLVERGAYRRALRLVLDETTRRATIDWSYGAPEPGRSTSSAQPPGRRTGSTTAAVGSA